MSLYTILFVSFCAVFVVSAKTIKSSDSETTSDNLLGLDWDGPAVETSDLLEVNSEMYNSLVESNWEHYKTKYGKSYDTDEEDTKRLGIWVDNFNKIIEHNLEYLQGIKNHRVKINKFADYEISEIKETFMGFKRITDVSVVGQKIFTARDTAYHSPMEKLRTASGASNPTTVDWRSSGCVTDVKDQGSCGSCWAFSATGSLEGLDCIWNKKSKDTSASVVALSEQNLVDCSSYLGNAGCNGGYTELAFTYVGQNVGIDSEACYSYTGVTGDSCVYNLTCRETYDIGYYTIPETDEASLEYHVANVGPVSVSIDAGTFEWIYYETGVYDDTSATCSNGENDLDHAVVAVGYGKDNDQDYWLVKNSWGSDWGDSGYIKMARNSNNLCGIATDACFPAVRGLMDYMKSKNLLHQKGKDEL